MKISWGCWFFDQFSQQNLSQGATLTGSKGHDLAPSKTKKYIPKPEKEENLSVTNDAL